jgi:hypothetical protein
MTIKHQHPGPDPHGWGIAEQAHTYMELLVGEDIRAVTDIRRINPPCVLIEPQSGVFNLMCAGQAETAWTLRCLAPGIGNQDALEVLSRLVSKVLTACDKHRIQIQTADLSTFSSDARPDFYPSVDLAFVDVASWI